MVQIILSPCRQDRQLVTNTMKYLSFTLVLIYLSLTRAFHQIVSNKIPSTFNINVNVPLSGIRQHMKQAPFPTTLFINKKRRAPSSTTLFINKKRREELGMEDDDFEYDLDQALNNNTDPFITKVIAGSLILVILALLVVGGEFQLQVRCLTFSPLTLFPPPPPPGPPPPAAPPTPPPEWGGGCAPHRIQLLCVFTSPIPTQ